MGKLLPYRANQTEMIQRVCDMTGLSWGKGESVWWGVIRVLSEEILAGREVRLHGIGTFRFAYYGPRTYAAHKFGKRMMPALTTSATYSLRFKTTQKFRAKLRKIIPLNPDMPIPMTEKMRLFKERNRQLREAEKAP